MFNPLKYFKTNYQLRQEKENIYQSWKKEHEELRRLKDISTPEIVIEKLLKEPLTYYDIDSKRMNERVDYYESAQVILKSPVYKNEFHGIVKDIIEHIAKKSQSHEETQGLRMSINYAELLDNRLNDIADPKKAQPSKDNVHAPI